MQALPVDVGLSFPIWLMLIGGLVLGVFLVRTIRYRHHPVQALAKFLVLGAALFGVVVFAKFSMVRTVRIENPSRPRLPATVAAQPLIRTPAPVESSVHTAEEADSALIITGLPEWTQQLRQAEGKKTLLTVKSGRFASLDEAELTAFDEAAKAAAQEFRDLDPRGVGERFPVQVDLVRNSAVKQRFNEIADHDFGKFRAPMYQVWLQIELTPELGEKIAEPWRQSAVAARLRSLTGWSLWGTAAAALAAFALRLDAAWNGRRRAAIAGTALVLTLGSLAFLV